jgi:hypothetical protein
MGINDIAPFIDYENVNRNAPYDPTMIDRMSEAKGMLQQNVPIEMIIPTDRCSQTTTRSQSYCFSKCTKTACAQCTSTKRYCFNAYTARSSGRYAR